jgi:iron(III) transport system substrate-binding protein
VSEPLTLVPRLAGRRGAAAFAALALALPMGVAACGDDESSDDSAGGTTLTVYSGREEEYVGPLFESYEEETGNQVDVRYGDSAELAATIREEGENSPADVFFSQDAGSLGAMQETGLLTELPDDVLTRVDERFRSTENDWVGTSGRARVVGYNTDVLSEADLPSSILDFTDPQWKGRIGWAPTNGSFQAFVTALRILEGDDAAREWLEGIVANEPEVFTDNEAIRDAIATGEIDVGFLNHYYIAEAQAEEGDDYPVAAYFPPGGDVGSLVNVAGAGVLASSDDSETATEFIEFVLAPEQQEYFTTSVKEYPLVEGVEADPALVPLDEIEQPNVDLANLSDLQGTLTLIEESGAL